MTLGLSGLSIGTQPCCSHATAALLRFDRVTSLLVKASLILLRLTPSLARFRLIPWVLAAGLDSSCDSGFDCVFFRVLCHVGHGRLHGYIFTDS